MKKAIFLDRDGTIIVDKHYLKTPDQVELLQNAIAGLTQLRDMGYLLIIATNQSGVARGYFSEEDINKVHRHMDSLLSEYQLSIAHYYYAPYGPDSDHIDRKPQPGMLLNGIKKFNLDPKQCWMIGDKMSDVVAGEKAGMKSALITKDKITENKEAKNHILVEDLLEFAKVIKD